MAEQLDSLSGKVAVVTGASRRIGRATALGLAARGAAVVVHARQSLEEVEGVAAEIRAAGGQAHALLADVTDPDAVREFVAKAQAAFSRIDILVNNAAIRAQTPMIEMTVEQWKSVTGVILDGAFYVTQAVLPIMIAGGGGTVINIGGMSAHTGSKGRVHVVSAKAALIGFTKAVAVEFAEQGVNANCVVPGKIGGQRSHTAGHAPPLIAGAMPIVGREGHVEEVAAMVVTLCLPSSRFITGQTIHVNGGQYLP